MAGQHSPQEARISGRQQAILEAIAASIAERGYAPTMRELAQRVGLASPSSVKHQLDVLQERGLIERDAHSPRAITINSEVFSQASLAAANTRIVPRRALNTRAQQAAATFVGERDLHTTPIPIVGQIAAGRPIMAQQAVEDVLPMPTQVVGSGELFMLRINGDSMIDAAICHGDLVVIRQQPDAQSGEIVAAMIDEEVTVKTLRRSDGHQWLMPANPLYTPIQGDDAVILGKLVALLRTV